MNDQCSELAPQSTDLWGGHKGAIIYNTPLGTFGGLSEVTKEDSGLAWNGEPRSSLTAG